MTAPQPEDDDVSLRHDAAQSRYVVELAGSEVGRADYRADPAGVRVFTHTEVDPTVEGRGLASQLMRFAFDDTRASGLRIRPVCPFVVRYVARHEQEYGDLVA